jgi:quercetin dioxygenase-like cupin family protein
MAKSGDVIGPVGGKTVTFLKTRADTNGELLQIEVTAEPFGPAFHSHPKGEERLEVISGRVNYQVGADKGIMSAGDSYVASEGTVHSWWNGSDEQVRIRINFYPDFGLEEYLDNVYGLIRDGKNLNKKGKPNLLQKAVLCRAYRDVLFEPPSYARKLFFNVLAPFGKLCGYKDRYKEYSNTA